MQHNSLGSSCSFAWGIFLMLLYSSPSLNFLNFILLEYWHARHLICRDPRKPTTPAGSLQGERDSLAVDANSLSNVFSHLPCLCASWWGRSDWPGVFSSPPRSSGPNYNPITGPRSPKRGRGPS
ncbi:hypothetical protein BU23DRAFT_193126 [Bimuria novae-zelandiae CBS 107.79]|uniref:Uncharacterized protein n=1 Tax=Bimuria novae-zelandiae CBS 107.79 TaxID=1447943 RepID=A0A6A5VTK8_9PLEO|nr:hypothetical protein BU23DRAFT_193126 [Bimuria novae-zelandiae CBS 107.79]